MYARKHAQDHPDRAAIIIAASGETVTFAEYEARCNAAVIGVPNEDLGEEVKAVVQLADPAAASPELAQELIGYCRDRIAHFKCPQTVDFVPELPRPATGKLYKRVLRDAYWAARKTPIV